MQSSMPSAATRNVHRGVISVRPYHQRHNPLPPMGASSSILTIYQRFLRYLRRLLSARRVVYDDFDIIAPRYRPQRINALCRITNFSKSEIKLMYQGFKQVCPTGVVNENTFKDIFGSYFPQGDASLYAHYVFKACDQQHNGTINFQEFLSGLSMMTRGATVDKLKWTFNLYDINGDGRITRDEMRQIINSVYLMLGKYTEPTVDEDTAREHADKVFRRLDLNQDGYVTFDEFLEICQKDENIISSLQLLDTVL